MKDSIFQNKIIKNILILLFWLTIWFLIARIVNQDLILPDPFLVFNTLIKLMATSSFWFNCLTSIYRILIGYLLGVTVSLLLVLLSCISNTFRQLISPIIKIIRSTPVASFIILALLWMSKSSVVSLIVMLMVVPIVYENVLNEYDNVDNKLLEMSKAYAFSFFKTLRNIYYPSILPGFLSALITSMGLGWKSGIAAEVLSLPKISIGSNLYYSKIYLETSELFAWTIVVVVLSSLIEIMIKRLLRGYLNDN